MAEEGQDGSSSDGSDPAALGLSLGGASRERADEYLRKQSRLADLQIDTLEKKDEFELSHLRFRRFSDYARFALELAAGFVVLLIVLGIATMVWSASRDRDLVVDAFSVPQDVAATGLTGSVLAGRVLDRYGHMLSNTNATTQGSGSYHADTADAVRVEIPDTGVSLGELNRYLRAWLGHETHVSGDLVRTAQGFALTVRFGAHPGVTLKDKTANLDTLVEKSAEQIYAAALPYRYVEYLVHRHRFAEAGALAPVLAVQGSDKERALANSAWAKVYFFQGDMKRALEKGRDAVHLDPDNPIAQAWLSVGENNLGHDEASRAGSDAALQAWQVHKPDAQMSVYPVMFAAYRDEQTGDYTDANAAWANLFTLIPMNNANANNAVSDAAAAHDMRTARRIASSMTAKDALGRPDAQTPGAYFSMAYFAGDWKAAVSQGRTCLAILRTQPDQKWTSLIFEPPLATALAETGDFRGADEMIAASPRDCDACMRERGRVAALEGRSAEAARDFAIVAARSPHEPFAETYWGQMLMSRGDFDGAIAKFEIANRKGPHFADPLEMWGEALIAKNRSDRAVAKFAEADKYAPKWGRLHLKWGEALLWSGDKMGAQTQFALASRLFLTAAERAQLSQMEQKHG